MSSTDSNRSEKKFVAGGSGDNCDLATSPQVLLGREQLYLFFLMCSGMLCCA